MPGLPGRPDLGQLHRQARELLRAAADGEPHATARIRAVSERTTLSAAQLALAREYGYRNWSALKDEVERRRRPPGPGAGQPPSGGAERGPLEAPWDRWSFGGGAAIETSTGVLLPEGLVGGAGEAVLFACLTPWENGQHAPPPAATQLARAVSPEHVEAVARARRGYAEEALTRSSA
jgi:hypothetical protein